MLEGLRYKLARRLLRFLTADYRGAGGRDHRRNWNPSNKHPHRSLRPQLSDLRARAADLRRNSALGAAHARILACDVIGPGIRIQPTAKKVNGDPLETWNRAVADVWSRMEKRIDMRRMQTFGEMQVTALTTYLERGCCLVHMPIYESDPDLPVPLQIYGIEPDYLTGDGVNRETGNEIRSGVELDTTTGRPVAFHIDTERHGFRTGNIKRIPAEKMAYVFCPDRWGQVLGAPACAPVLGEIHDLGEYVETEMVRADASARHTHYIRTPHIEQRMKQWQSDLDEEELRQGYSEEIERGVRTFLYPDEEPYETGANIPPSNFDSFVRQIQRWIAAGLGLSYERLTGDYSDTHFSAARANWYRDIRFIQSLQRLISNRFCLRVHERMVDVGVMAGVLPVAAHQYFGSPAYRDRLLQANCRPPGFNWHDPSKDIQAAAGGVALGVMTRSEICEQFGQMPFEKVVDRLAEEEELLKKKGLQAVSVPGDLAMLFHLINQNQDDEDDQPRRKPDRSRRQDYARN